MNQAAAETSDEKNNPYEVTGWCMYDWANSVYPLVVNTTLFPIYYYNVMPAAVRLFGIEISSPSLRIYAISLSYLLIVLLGPPLAGLADAMGRKKVFLMAACYTGAIACACLAGFSPEMIVLGMGCFVLATFSFALSDGFYNAFLPDIVTPDRYDRVSARGYSLGYVGSVLLVIICLVLVFNAEYLGMTAGQTTRIAFIVTGVWWAGFGTFTFVRLRERKPSTPAKINTDALTAGFRELMRCTVELTKLPTLRLFLITFFFYDMGVQTVMNIATDFGADELHLETGTMIIALLIIQFIAIIGAYFFSWLSEKRGNIVALQTAVIIWCGICSYAYFITTAVEFYTLGALVGLTMGGIQSTSRAAYSKLLPADHPANASFFSFYSVLDKIAVIVGTFIFALTRDITHSMRGSIIFLITFFVIGLLLLTVVNWGKKMAPHQS